MGTFFCLHAELLPSKNFLLTNGTGSSTVSINSNTNHKSIHQNLPLAPKIRKRSYKDAMILNQIKQYKDKYVRISTSGNFLSIPASFKKESEIAQIRRKIQNKKHNKLPKTFFLMLKCFSVQNYKIYSSVTMQTVCYSNDNEKYKLYSRIKVVSNKTKMIVQPYLMITQQNKLISLKKKSRLYNALSGSDNLATFVNERAIERVKKAMGDTIGTETGSLAKKYIQQEYKANSSVVTNSNGLQQTTTTQTTNPKPKIADYGITLLIDTISAGLKAGTDQLYRNLGYIYYIPKDSVFNAEVYFSKN